MAELAIKYNREELNQKVPYAVIVECWDHAKSGKGKRCFFEEFTETERLQIKKWYPIFYRWHLVKGVPEYAFFTVREIQLTQRAGNFFASI